MKLSEIHPTDKEVSAKAVSEKIKSNVITLQIKENSLLKEHITKTPAVLICIVGKVVYEDENDNKITLRPGDFYEIKPMVKHWVKGIKNSQLILTK